MIFLLVVFCLVFFFFQLLCAAESSCYPVDRDRNSLDSCFVLSGRYTKSTAASGSEFGTQHVVDERITGSNQQLNGPDVKKYCHPSVTNVGQLSMTADVVECQEESYRSIAD
jgi:hypothetical protein